MHIYSLSLISDETHVSIDHKNNQSERIKNEDGRKTNSLIFLFFHLLLFLFSLSPLPSFSPFLVLLFLSFSFLTSHFLLFLILCPSSSSPLLFHPPHRHLSPLSSSSSSLSLFLPLPLFRYLPLSIITYFLSLPFSCIPLLLSLPFLTLLLLLFYLPLPFLPRWPGNMQVYGKQLSGPCGSKHLSTPVRASRVRQP